MGAAHFATPADARHGGRWTRRVLPVHHGAMRSRPGSSTLFAALLLTAAGLACTRPQPGPPPIQLIETRPVEASLGDPSLPTALDTWLELIDSAETSLDFEEFYMSTWPGEPLEQVMAAIGRAVERGVRVRIILDSRMYSTYPQPADSLDALDGIDVRTIDLGRIAGGVQHAKFFVVDGGTVCLGSQNMDWRALKHIHELGVVLRDARVAGAFQQVFDMDWAAAGAGENDPEADGAVLRQAGLAALGPRATAWPVSIEMPDGREVGVRPSFSPKHFSPDSTLWDRDAIVELLDSAEREAVVQLLSYTIESYGMRDSTLDAALRRAAARGVNVRLLISDWQADSESRMRALQDLSAVSGIDAKLSYIAEWSGGYIPFARVDHCKFMVVDGSRVWIGTSNWGPGYFETSRNVAVTIEDPELAGRVRGIFETGWSDAAAIDVSPDGEYAPRTHGEEPPSGSTLYGG